MISSKSISEKTSFVAAVIDDDIEKSVTSAVNSKYSGISRSRFSCSLSFRLSESPGKAVPRTMNLSPSAIYFPFVTSILLNLLLSRIAADTITNGTYISSLLLPFFTVIR